ncbi:MAG: response regulator [Myxococcota bacterium]
MTTGDHELDAPPLEAPTVLIVEDEAIVALALRRQLENAGLHVAGMASSGEDAIALARRERPNVVLVDVRLRGAMDGITAGEELYVCEDIPVVYVSAYSDRATLLRATASGAYGYLTKPYSEDILVATLIMTIEKHRELVRLREVGPV